MKPALMMDFRTVSTPAVLPPKASAPVKRYSDWSEDDLAAAMRAGTRKEGHVGAAPKSKLVPAETSTRSASRLARGAALKAEANERAFAAIQGRVSAGQIAATLGITASSVHVRMIELEAAGRIRRITGGQQHLFERLEQP